MWLVQRRRINIVRHRAYYKTRITPYTPLYNINKIGYPVSPIRYIKKDLLTS